MAIAAKVAAMNPIIMYSTISFTYELDVIGAGMHELELEGTGKALVEGVESLEAAGVHFLGIELGRCTEHFHYWFKYFK